MLRGWIKLDTSRSIRESSMKRSSRRGSLAATHRIEQSRFAKEQEERGHAYRTGKFIDEMRRHFRLELGLEVRVLKELHCFYEIVLPDEPLI